AVLGYAFKKDTNDSRESPAIDICRRLLEEKACLRIYDPKVPVSEIFETLGLPQPDAEPSSSSEPVVTCCESAEDACEGTHALAILTEWDTFRDLDYAAIYDSMVKPAFAFDGRNLLDLEALQEIGFQVFGIGKG
ncbi:MAG: UDP binding domain-containing protein, partial [Opitutales bacterium]